MPVSRSKRKPTRSGRLPSGARRAEGPRPERGMRLWLTGDRRLVAPAFIVFALAPLAVAASQTIPHIYWFGELGFLYPFTVYDIALAILGLGILGAELKSDRRLAVTVGVFVVTLIAMLADFGQLWAALLTIHFDDQVYLVTPICVGLAGIALWLPARMRFPAAIVVAIALGIDLAFFVGLQEFSDDINSFTIGATVAAAWMAGAPAFLLRRFRRPWLPIAGRILASWLVTIEILLFVFATVPMKPGG